MQISSFKQYASGLTLVELMIAMALSLLLMGGAVGIFISSKQAYRTQDAMSRNQEAGRFSIFALSQQIRSAGYIGCSSLEDTKPNVISKPAPSNGFDLNASIIGYEGGANSASNGSAWRNPTSVAWVPNTDVIIISNGGECGADLTEDMGTTNAKIQVANNASCGFKADEALLITDCGTADLFRASSVSASGGNLAIAHAESSNTTNALSRAYKKGSTVLRFQQTTFFIGTTPYGNPALYRIDADGSSEAAVDNVEDMQIEYGVDSGSDGIVDTYSNAKAVTDWSHVLSARVSLLVHSDDGVISKPQSVIFNGTTVNAGSNADKRLRSIFNATVSLRNRLP